VRTSVIDQHSSVPWFAAALHVPCDLAPCLKEESRIEQGAFAHESGVIEAPSSPGAHNGSIRQDAAWAVDRLESLAARGI